MPVKMLYKCLNISSLRCQQHYDLFDQIADRKNQKWLHSKHPQAIFHMAMDSVEIEY